MFVDTFTEWMEAFPCKTKRATEVIKVLLSENIPRFLPSMILQRDSGLSFTVQVTQQIAHALKIKCFLHSAWHPQSFSMVEKADHTLKGHLLSLETQKNWVTLLLIGLLRIRTTPK